MIKTRVTHTHVHIYIHIHTWARHDKYRRALREKDIIQVIRDERSVLLLIWAWHTIKFCNRRPRVSRFRARGPRTLRSIIKPRHNNASFSSIRLGTTFGTIGIAESVNECIIGHEKAAVFYMPIIKNRRRTSDHLSAILRMRHDRCRSKSEEDICT